MNKPKHDDDMTPMEWIYAYYTVGSSGFVRAVQDYGGYDVTDIEIAAIASKARTAAEFQRIWENETWWYDATRARDAYECGEADARLGRPQCSHKVVPGLGRVLYLTPDEEVEYRLGYQFTRDCLRIDAESTPYDEDTASRSFGWLLLGSTHDRR